jgi:hypothetical protein
VFYSQIRPQLEVNPFAILNNADTLGKKQLHNLSHNPFLNLLPIEANP